MSLIFLLLALNSFNSVPALPTHVADVKARPQPRAPRPRCGGRTAHGPRPPSFRRRRIAAAPLTFPPPGPPRTPNGQLFSRERRAGTYSALPYALAKTLGGLPFILTQSLVYVASARRPPSRPPAPPPQSAPREPLAAPPGANTPSKQSPPPVYPPRRATSWPTSTITRSAAL